MPYYQGDAVEVYYDETLDSVVLEWEGFVSDDPFREAMDAAIELARERNAIKMLGDSREMGTLDQEDQEWSFTDWAPRAEEVGLEHLAVVYPESVVAAMSVDNVIEATEGDDIERTVTDSRDEAEAWLAAR